MSARRGGWVPGYVVLGGGLRDVPNPHPQVERYSYVNLDLGRDARDGPDRLQRPTRRHAGTLAKVDAPAPDTPSRRCVRVHQEWGGGAAGPYGVGVDVGGATCG